ncbi:MAG TPA: TadE/TadG family type IV pilus assembly protein [Xanthobacteraceae bacterium]|jgi:Flp pilus assembly protein TadG
MLTILKNRLAAGRKRLASAAGFARREDGAAALEFAIVAAPFLALILATAQTTLAFFAGQVLESAATDASRIIAALGKWIVAPAARASTAGRRNKGCQFSEGRRRDGHGSGRRSRAPGPDAREAHWVFR